jgi:hypothetical protein
MEKPTKTIRKQLSFGLILLCATAGIFSSCNQQPAGTSTTTTTSDSTKHERSGKIGPLLVTNVAAVVRDEWNGGSGTEANDSVLYTSGGNSYKAYTNSSGQASLSDGNYTAGNPITMEGCANSLICGKLFNQAFTKITDDNNLISPEFDIKAAGTGDSIPVYVTVTDLSGNPRSGYTVQFRIVRTNYGTAVTTDASGNATYSKKLTQSGTYIVQASGTGGNSQDITVSTTPLSGSGGNFSTLNVYIRY